MTKQRGLGRGIQALIPTDTPSGGVREVPIEDIRQNSRQPRSLFDEAALDELAASIREHGIIQPLIVSERDEGKYELIAGERRWRAAQRAGLTRVPVVVRETTPQQLLELALIENVQRSDLNPLEEARAYQTLHKEFQLTDAQIAHRVGKNNRVTIANTRRLLNLPSQAQDAILANKITAGHGRALLMLNEPDHQLMALEALIAHDLSVREAERLSDLINENGGDVHGALMLIRQQRNVRSTGSRQPKTARQLSDATSPITTADDRELVQTLEQALETPVRVMRTQKDLQITITFHTHEKLQQFLDMLNM